MIVSIFAGISLAEEPNSPDNSPSSPKVVLELFTSQGCSSCPPADALLEQYIMRSDVIALSLPVDYWDNLGWKDTFASPDYSKRQRDYARARGDGQVYTPQIVVNGLTHAVGSSANRIDQAITAAKTALATSQVPIRIRLEGDNFVVDAGEAPANSPLVMGTLLLAVVQPSGKVAIRRGENGGREVTYHNIVRALKPIGKWSGKPLTITLSRQDFVIAEGRAVAVLLQVGKAGPIVGVAQIKLD